MNDVPGPSGGITHAADGAPTHPAPRPSLPEHDTAAWMLAALPLAVTAIRLPAMSIEIAQQLVSVAGLVASFGLVVADRRMLVGAGRLSPATKPGLWRALLPPIYLYARAKRLGTTLILFWLSLASIVLAGMLGLTMAAMTAEASALPACDDDVTVTAAMGAFNSTLLVRQADIHAIAVTNETEIAQGPGPRPRERACTAMIRASDDVAYPVDYTVDLTEHDQPIVHLRLQAP